MAAGVFRRLPKGSPAKCKVTPTQIQTSFGAWPGEVFFVLYCLEKGMTMAVPNYPAKRPLALDDKPLLDEIFLKLQPRVSEFTFANLYLFRSVHAYRLTMVGDALVVMGKGYAGDEYFLPPLTGDIATALSVLLNDGLTLYGADVPFVERYFQGGNVAIAEDRDNFDYLHLRSEMAELPGNRFHKKKNRINYFTRRHAYRVELYADSHRDGALQLLDEWYRIRSEADSGSRLPETEATREALAMAGQLGLTGVVVLVEERVRAFILGERLNNDTSVCHFEKADPFLNGLTQLVDREFNRLLFADCTFVNREQDLGAPNLRNSKLTYHPVELIKKFKVRARL